jgi:hypothetical protein
VARKLTEIEQHVDRVRQAVTAATRKRRKAAPPK